MATKNLFHSLRKHGDDTHFVPMVTNDFQPTDAPAGSPEKIRVLAYRVQRGFPLWHPLDGCRDEEFEVLAATSGPKRTLLLATSAAMNAAVQFETDLQNGVVQQRPRAEKSARRHATLTTSRGDHTTAGRIGRSSCDRVGSTGHLATAEDRSPNTRHHGLR